MRICSAVSDSGHQATVANRLANLLNASPLSRAFIRLHHCPVSADDLAQIEGGGEGAEEECAAVSVQSVVTVGDVCESGHRQEAEQPVPPSPRVEPPGARNYRRKSGSEKR